MIQPSVLRVGAVLSVMSRAALAEDSRQSMADGWFQCADGREFRCRSSLRTPSP